MTDEERFGAAATGASTGEAAVVSGRFPTGWTRLRPTPLRKLNVRVDGHREVECYLSWLPGEAGGVLANVNRWRDQLGLPPITPDDLLRLPRMRVLGADAVVVDLQGTWTGAGGPPRSDWRMAGMIATTPTATFFLKMTGPASEVGAELPALRSFAASLHFDRAGAPSDDDADRAANGDDVTWEAPPGWREGSPRPTRAVTFHPGDDPEVECYVTVLRGDGGGVLANLNRWRSQLGATPLTADDADALPRVDVLGHACALLETEGTLQDADGAHLGQAVLATVCTLDDAALFVKMTGPAARVRAEREAFLAFCRSLTR